MNDIGATGQAFIDTLFAQLHGFRFICLLQPRSLTVVDGRVVTLGPITHFVTTQLCLRDKSGRIHKKTLDLFPTKLGQYPIILGLLWFKKHSPHIQFDKNTVTFNSPHCPYHCSLSHQLVTVSGLNTPFNHPLCLPTLSYQAVNVSNADDFAPDPRSCLLSLSLSILSELCALTFVRGFEFPNMRNRLGQLLFYHRYCSRPSPHQAVNISSIDKPTKRRSRSCSMSLSLSTSNQTFVSADTPWSHNSCPRYSYTFCHRLNIADSLKTMNQELLRPKDWISPTVSDSQEDFTKLPTLDISMIGAVPFNILV